MVAALVRGPEAGRIVLLGRKGRRGASLIQSEKYPPSSGNRQRNRDPCRSGRPALHDGAWKHVGQGIGIWRMGTAGEEHGDAVWKGGEKA